MRNLFKLYKDSVVHAVEGILSVAKEERNLRIQLTVGILVVLTGMVVNLSRDEWLVIIIVIALVLILELINSALERLLDIIRPRLHQQVKIVKDILAAAVLLASLLAVIVGVIIFWPYFFD